MATDCGLVRKENQDNFYLCGLINEEGVNKLSTEVELSDKTPFICAVFDGMGGESFGKEVSKLAATKLSHINKDLLESDDEKHISNIIKEYAKDINASISMRMVDSEKFGGTTAVVLICKNRTIRTYYAGDSRAYLFRNNVLTLITKDHTVAQEKIDAGDYTEYEARNKREWHILTRYLGDNKMLVQGQSVYVMKGDVIVICSDGITDMCNEQRIVDILKKNNALDAQVLVQDAVEHGGCDNATCVVMKF